MGLNVDKEQGMFRRLLQNEVTWLVIVIGIVLSVQNNFSTLQKDVALANQKIDGVLTNTDGISAKVGMLEERLRQLEASVAVLKARNMIEESK